MTKKIVSFTLSERNLKKIDKTAKALGMTRSALMDLMIEKGFHFSEDVRTAIDKISELQQETEERMKE